MCPSKTRVLSTSLEIDQNVAKINGRPVLHPNCNRVPNSLERQKSTKNTSPKPPTSLTSPLLSPKGTRTTRPSPSTPPSPKTKSPRSIPSDHNVSSKVNVEKLVPTIKSPPKIITSPMKSLSKNSSVPILRRSNSMSIVESAGSIAAARREQVAILQSMRKMRIAHYGRTTSAKYTREYTPLDSPALFQATNTAATTDDLKNRCSFLFPNSDPICVTYHDEEWGVPVYDDKTLFELLVLTTAQVGSDWTSVLKKRQQFRAAFSDFDAELVGDYNEKKVALLCSEYGIELSQVRGAIDNANQILKVKEQFGSFKNYLWRFVKNKPICTQYKSIQRIPVKSSKSEAISKDMIKRGFRFVGPAVIHSFMQAAGLTNDHLVTCPRHSYCSTLAK